MYEQIKKIFIKRDNQLLTVIESREMVIWHLLQFTKFRELEKGVKTPSLDKEIRKVERGIRRAVKLGLFFSGQGWGNFELCSYEGRKLGK